MSVQKWQFSFARSGIQELLNYWEPTEMFVIVMILKSKHSMIKNVQIPKRQKFWILNSMGLQGTLQIMTI